MMWEEADEASLNVLVLSQH